MSHTNVGGTLVRRPLSFETHFTQIPNAYLRDERLSFKARGVLAHLMTHNDGHEVSLKSLADNSSDGLAAIRTAVVELEHFGYLHRETARGSKGTYGTRWELIEPALPLFEAEKSTAFENRTRSATAFENRTNTAFENRTHIRTPSRTLNKALETTTERAKDNADASGGSHRDAIASTEPDVCPRHGATMIDERHCEFGCLVEVAS